MGFFSVCKKDHLLIEIRNTFGATPLRVPESMISPLYVFGWDGKRTTDKKGELHHLFPGGGKIEIPISNSQMANISSKKSRRMNTSVGIDLLDGFIKALGFTVNPFSFAFEGVKQVSFSFSDVQRNFVDKNLLGKKLSSLKLDLSNPSLADFKNGNLKFMLIDSVIVSPSFTIHTEKTATNDFAMEVKAINEAVSKANVSAKVEVRGQKDLSFEGDSPLAFAITSMPIDVNWENGKIIGFGSIEGPNVLGESDTQPIIGMDGEMIEWD